MSPSLLPRPLTRARVTRRARRSGSDAQARRWGIYGASQVSERTRQHIDDEVKRVVEEAHDEAIRLVTENRSRLDALTEALLRDETLDQPQAYTAAGLAPPPEDDTAPVEAAAPVAT